MLFEFVIIPDAGEPFEVKAGPRDVLAWESAVPGASLRTLLIDYRMTDMYQLAYFTAKRAGVKLAENMTLAEWLKSVDVERGEIKDASPDPTPPEASADPS